MKITTAVLGVFVLTMLCSGCGSRQGEANPVNPMPTVSQEDFVKKAEGLLAQRNYGEAVRLFKDIIAKDPNNVKAHFILGQTYMRLESYNDALKQFETVTNLAPTHNDAYLLLGGCYDLLGDRPKAMALVKKSVEVAQVNRDEEGFKRSLVILQQMMTAEQKQTTVEQ